MPPIPADFNQWTFDTIVAVVEGYSGEPDWFDFKEVLNAAEGKAEHNLSIQRATCALANADGGYIIFGVKDSKASARVRAIERVVGIPESGELAKEFGDKLGQIAPSPGFVPISRPIQHGSIHGMVIFPVYVPRSLLRPHALRLRDGHLVFYRRGDGGSAVPMDVTEIREQMIFHEDRRRKLRLYRLKLLQTERISDELQSVDPALSFSRFETDVLDSLLADVCSLLPEENPVLLYDLADISEQARAINEALDRLHAQLLQYGVPQPRFGMSLAQIVNSRAFALKERCAESKRKLDAIFGKLPF